jgi:hypothetical protein
MKRGIVVATHPEDHSVDLVLSDGRRLSGVQVMSPNGSARSGTVDMPAVPPKSGDKWDISQPNGQDQIAIVEFVGTVPVVVGFLFPQVSQMTFADPKLKVTRHQSDVVQIIDGDGNIDLLHPSGFSIRIGESPEHAQPAGKNFDKNLAVDRNTGRKPYIRLTMADGTAQLTIAPDGAITLTTNKGISATCGEPVVVTAPKVTLDTPLVEVPNGDVVASGISLVNHVHSGIQSGPSNTGAPVG